MYVCLYVCMYVSVWMNEWMHSCMYGQHLNTITEKLTDGKERENCTKGTNYYQLIGRMFFVCIVDFGGGGGGG